MSLVLWTDEENGEFQLTETGQRSRGGIPYSKAGRAMACKGLVSNVYPRNKTDIIIVSPVSQAKGEVHPFVDAAEVDIEGDRLIRYTRIDVMGALSAEKSPQGTETAGG